MASDKVNSSPRSKRKLFLSRDIGDIIYDFELQMVEKNKANLQLGSHIVISRLAFQQDGKFTWIKAEVLICCTTLAVLTKSLHALTPLADQKSLKRESHTNKLLDLLLKLANSDLGKGRRLNDANLQKARAIFNLLTKNMDVEQVKDALRQGKTETQAKQPAKQEPNNEEEQEKRTSQEHANIVEKELSSTLNQQSSALMEKPYVESKGRNDFLVMKDSVSDPFVTVIPNAVYYNIEKKCANWLDDCSLDGIRAKIFQAIRSPY